MTQILQQQQHYKTNYRTKQRLVVMANHNFYGTDGLPHLIADSNCSCEFTVPGVMFLYIAGWIVWVGHVHLQLRQLKSK